MQQEKVMQSERESWKNPFSDVSSYPTVNVLPKETDIAMKQEHKEKQTLPSIKMFCPGETPQNT